jgi:hypothetical protein
MKYSTSDISLQFFISVDKKGDVLAAPIPDLGKETFNATIGCKSTVGRGNENEMGNTLPVKLSATDDVFNRNPANLAENEEREQNSKTGETVYSEWRVNETR